MAQSLPNGRDSGRYPAICCSTPVPGMTRFSGEPTFNDPPVVMVTNTTAQAGTVISIGNLLSASDVNGDAITAWRLRDTTADRGAFRIDGVVQPDFQEIEVMASQLAAVEFLAGNAPGFNRLTASAFDGTSWSDPKTFIINTLSPV